MAVRCVAIIAVMGVLTACAAISDLTRPAGSREWLVTVENLSTEPARIFVAEDEFPMGQAVGTVAPDTIAPGATELVAITLPPGQNWAIFVNPTEEVGALIGWDDAPPDARGSVPLTITVGPDGMHMVQMPGEPGWFAN